MGGSGQSAKSGGNASGGSSGSATAGSGSNGSGGSAGSSGSMSSGSSGSAAGASGASGGSGMVSSGTSAPMGGVWVPPSVAPIHFHWELSTNFSTSDLLTGQQGSVVYDIDGEGSSAADVQAIHAAGAKAVCYVDVGTLEQGRSDYKDFPTAVVGPDVVGWPGENWLLVTAANQSVILPLMKARLTNWCQGKGFDAVEPDNLDAWTNIKGISETDNVAYDLAVAGLAHGLSLSVGLKNTLSDASASNQATMVSTFDWALVEQCYEYTECTPYAQFVSASKAVWDVEYNAAPNCTQADAAHLNAQLRDLNLAGPHDSGYKYAPCIPDSQATW
jgi:hypothetical protein